MRSAALSARRASARSPCARLGRGGVIDGQDIKARKIMPISLMPEGLLQAFTSEQQRDPPRLSWVIPRSPR